MTTSIDEPVYKIICPACHKVNLYSIFDVLNKTRCTAHATKLSRLLIITGVLRLQSF